MEAIERSERQWQEEFKSLGSFASLERSLKEMAEPSEAAKRFMEEIERSVRQSEDAFKLFDASWLKELSEPSEDMKRMMEEIRRSLSEPLKLYVPPEPTCRLVLTDQFEVDYTPPCGGRRVGFHRWE